MKSVYWLGAGLSSAPGIQRIANGFALTADTHHPAMGREPVNLVVWDRNSEAAAATLQGTAGLGAGTAAVSTATFDDLTTQFNPHDVVVSMLPGDWHVRVAEAALTAGAHFVSSSYTAPGVADLHEAATQAGLCLVNEVGLDPGIDHLLAHDLVHGYRSLSGNPAGHRLQFRSFCGGFPSIPNDFRYKFSWSPEGVLKALAAPAQWRAASATQTSDNVWNSIGPFDLMSTGGDTEAFECYPNRDSLPFMASYGFDEQELDEFVRGTLRLAGWAAAWQPIFDRLKTWNPVKEAGLLADMAGDLWKQHAYATNEPDRVVLTVELVARDSSGAVTWHQQRVLDVVGNHRGSAMARLVSIPVSLAVESVLAGDIKPGVSQAPSNPALVARWLDVLAANGDVVDQRTWVGSA